VHFSDVQAVAPYVLGHRITLRADVKFSAKKDLPLDIVAGLLESVPTVDLAPEPEPTIVVATAADLPPAPATNGGGKKRRWRMW
jgi:hypothetical protein